MSARFSLSTTWVLASHNEDKYLELSALLAPYGVTVRSQSSLAISPTKEPFPSFVENALAKARYAAKHSGLPAIADDSGICAVALNGQPGIHSARFAAKDDKERPSAADNNRKLNQLLLKEQDKRVFYYCCLVWVRNEHDPTPIIAEGKWDGQWQIQAQGCNGFGYDPHFFLPEKHTTVASLTIQEKNRFSHRARAFSSLLEKISQCQ